MTKLDELLGRAAEETIDKVTTEAIEELLPNGNIEKIWDKFRALFRGTEIRGAIHEAQNKTDAKQVLIAKLKNISIQAEKLIPILKEVQQKADEAVNEIETMEDEEENGQ